MEKSNPSKQEIVGDQPAGETPIIRQFSLEKEGAVSQECYSSFRGGDFDGATQPSWPVLLESEVVAVSVPATKSVCWFSDGGGGVVSDSASGEERKSGAASVKVSLSEAWRQVDSGTGDVVCGLFWGERR